MPNLTVQLFRFHSRHIREWFGNSFACIARIPNMTRMRSILNPSALLIQKNTPKGTLIGCANLGSFFPIP